MNVEFPIPDQLDIADFSRLIFSLEFSGDFDLSLEAFLRLRRGLLQAAKQIGEDGPAKAAEALFDPPLASDPVARRRFQRPAPAFVMRPPLSRLGAVSTGVVVPLEVLFIGHGIETIPLFIRTLTQLGEQGLFQGKGHFKLVEVFGINDAEQHQPLWSGHGDLETLAFPVSNLQWWLERCDYPAHIATMTFATPTRLLSNGRPLFDPTFGQLFPFVLRRVTSMLYAHCDLEVVSDPARLLEIANTVHADCNQVRWEDWRTLSGRQDLGGILGEIQLNGPELTDLLWVLYLGSLFQVGKGATYGAGFYTFNSDPL